MEKLRLAGNDAVKVSRATVYNTFGLFVRKGSSQDITTDASHVFDDSNLVRYYR